jgi:hypothetical protein
VSCRGRSFFAEIDEGGAAAGHAYEHESAATDISCVGMGYGQREADGYGGIDRIAS